ncbi:MAG: DUF4179 domain-containing protein, partial [Oscillospiraceae bacterium]|nr:DUF4179 domain-containing protein [Oscillospiraceae bacterium]
MMKWNNIFPEVPESFHARITETLNEQTNNKIERIHYMKNKKLIAIFAVALAILIMGMGAYAANVAANLRSEQLREAFGRAGEELDKDELNALESIGSNGNPSITSNGTTMEVTAAVYETKEETIDHLDNDGILVRRETYNATHYYLALKIIAPEG